MGLQIGEAVLGEVIAIKPYGAFVQLPEGKIGMIHISEVAEEYVKDIHDYLHFGQEVVVKIIGVNEEGKYNLSIRQLTKREEEAARYAHQVQEFRKVLESRQEEFQSEVSWRRLAKEKQRTLASSRTSLLNWLKGAKKTVAQLSQRRRERQRSYKSLDLE